MFSDFASRIYPLLSKRIVLKFLNLEVQKWPLVIFQVLEGLKEHNDSIRGMGHFHRVMSFLVEARKQRMETHVMLTLIRGNMKQVIPLGEELRGLTTRFTFNRLSQVGEGAALELPSKQEYIDFLGDYMNARRLNPVLGFKDNLFNIIRDRFKRPLFPGCTGGVIKSVQDYSSNSKDPILCELL